MSIQRISSNTINKSQNNTSNKSNIKYVEDYNDDSNNSIQVARSDGLKHDLVSVFANTKLKDVKAIVANTKRTSFTEDKNLDIECDSNNNISLNRSDGIGHDVIKIVKAKSDTGISGIVYNNSNNSNSNLLNACVKRPSLTFGKTEVQSNPNRRDSLSSRTSICCQPTSIRIVHMSDTHNQLIAPHNNQFLPIGNILVHSGGFSLNGTDDEYKQFDNWLRSVTPVYHYRVVVLGKRDVNKYGNDWDTMRLKLPNASHVLCHNEATILGIRFYGCPWYYGHKSDQTDSKNQSISASHTRFKDIPEGTQVLITHAASYGRLDRVNTAEEKELHWGCRELSEVINKIKPGIYYWFRLFI
jgi:hypothetical protein